MADKKISELTALTGADTATDDQLVIVDTSAGLTKNITVAEFQNALDGSTGFVRITGDTMTGDLNFGDNDKAVFGAGSDLQIYHDGTHSVIDDTGTGNLILQSNGAQVSLQSTTELYLTAANNGAVTAYHNGSEKLATTSTGIDVTGDATFADNGKAIFGASSDLQIYHDGSNSFIEDTGTGDLNIRANDNLRLQSATTNENFLKADSDGAVTLYHNNIERIATTSTGIDVTGTVTADGLTVDGAFELFGTSDAFGSTASSAYILKTGSLGTAPFTQTGALLYQPRTSTVDGRSNHLFYTGDPLALRMNIQPSGDISFYEDTGTTAKFFWDASAERLGIGNAAPTTALDVTGTVTADGLTVSDTQASGGVGIDIINVGDGGISTTPYTYIASKLNPTRNGGEIRFTRANTYGSAVQADANIELYTTVDDVNKLALKVHSGGDISFYEDTGTTPTFFWDASEERLGIGTTSPATKLEVDGDIGIGRSSGGYTFREVVGGGERASLKSNASNELLFSIGAATEAMRITSSGSVGIGTSSPTAASGTTVLEITGTSGNAGAEVIIGSSDTTATANDLFGGLAFKSIDSNGTPPHYSGIKARAADTFGGASLEFYAGRSNYESNDPRFVIEGPQSVSGEAMRIDSSGNALIGYTSSNGSYKLQVNSQIFATSSTIATSDGRYKENVTPLTGALDLVSALNPVHFDWKSHSVHDFDTKNTTIGFIAQEVEDVLADKPYLGSIVKSNTCVITPEETDEDGNVIAEAVTEEFLGIAEGNLVALLTAALQEALTKIDALETRITALEG